MMKQRVYTDAPPEVDEAFTRSVRVKDFLPPPKKLVLRKSISEMPEGYMSLEEFKNRAIQHIRTFAKENCLYK